MAHAPCGCDLAMDAAQERDARGRDVLLGEAERAARRWGCRFGGGGDGVARDPDCVRALRAVEQVVGAPEGELSGCPCAEVREPDALEAMAARRWFRAGQLHLRVGHPSAALVEAVDLIETGLAQREADDLRRARARAESMTPHKP